MIPPIYSGWQIFALAAIVLLWLCLPEDGE